MAKHKRKEMIEGTDDEFWAAIQERGRPSFTSCPNCDNASGTWVGFHRIDEGIVDRRRRCSRCGRIYHAARFISEFGEIDDWEACFLLSWEPFYKDWLAEQEKATKQ